jgi:DNA-binding transcriptional regulator PaaX
MSEMNQINRQALMDNLLKFVAGGGFLTTALAAPNAVQVFDKSMYRLLKKLDKRAQQRELRRAIHYMKTRGLIKYDTRDYEHGIELTKAGKEHLVKRNYETMNLAIPKKWDKKWRLVFFDIPEDIKTKRNVLTLKLKSLGFRQLQKSIWIHPFSCRPEIEAVCEVLDIRRFVTLVEITEIDNEALLKERFPFKLK